MQECQKRLSGIVNERFTLVGAGLLDSTCKRLVFDPGSLGASVYSDAPGIERGTSEELCDFVEAAAFFREHIRDTDRVWMKLNCEGAEVAVLENLMRSGEARKLHNVLIDFDAARIPSQRRVSDA